MHEQPSGLDLIRPARTFVCVLTFTIQNRQLEFAQPTGSVIEDPVISAG